MDARPRAGRSRRIACAGALLAGALFGCGAGDEPSRVAILLEVPADDGDGALLADLESLEFRVSDGNAFVDSQLYSVAGGLPSELVLPSVPTGNRVVFDLSGFAGDAEIAYGRTCRLVVNEAADEVNARLYFSRVGRFRAGQPPLEPERRAGLMFSDNRGRAIVAGGADTSLVELFDPRVGLFLAAGEAQARTGGAIAVRDDGTAVVAGGVDPEEGVLVAGIEEIDPSSGADSLIRRLGPMDQPEAQRTGLALVALPDRTVLLTGGRTASRAISDGVAALTDGDDEFRPDLREDQPVLLDRPRSGHTASVGLGDLVYIIGGLTVDKGGKEVATGSIETYREQDQTVRTLAAGLSLPRFGHSATVLPDGRILVVGGKVPRSEPCEPRKDPDPETCFDAADRVEVFDPIVGEVRTIERTIEGGIYDHTATLMSGGRVLIAGGFDSSGSPRRDAWLFDPQVEALFLTQELTSARAGHTATELCDGTILLVGGQSGDGRGLPSERYNPASSRDP